VNYSEKVARTVIEAVIPGSRMVYRCDQSKGLHDFDLYYDDRRVGAVEVTASVDAPGRETEAAILDHRKGGRRIKAERCKWPWRISPGPLANIDRIRQDADRYLAEIESQGIRRFDPASVSHGRVSVERIYRDLNIYSGDAELGESGSITMCLPTGFSFAGSSLVIGAVTLVALKSDNRRKLASAGTAERHLFVFIDRDNHGVWTSLVESAPPPETVSLPDEVTDAWAVGQARTENQYVVWRASNGSRWQNLGPVTAPLRKSD
jgi:hypothetical protein